METEPEVVPSSRKVRSWNKLHSPKDITLRYTWRLHRHTYQPHHSLLFLHCTAREVTEWLWWCPWCVAAEKRLNRFQSWVLAFYMNVTITALRRLKDLSKTTLAKKITSLNQINLCPLSVNFLTFHPVEYFQKIRSWCNFI